MKSRYMNCALCGEGGFGKASGHVRPEAPDMFLAELSEYRAVDAFRSERANAKGCNKATAGNVSGEAAVAVAKAEAAPAGKPKAAKANAKKKPQIERGCAVVLQTTSNSNDQGEVVVDGAIVNKSNEVVEYLHHITCARSMRLTSMCEAPSSYFFGHK